MGIHPGLCYPGLHLATACACNRSGVRDWIHTSLNGCFKRLWTKHYLCTTLQVARCEDVTIEACTWNSETSENIKQAIARDLHAGQPSCKLLYTTPESLRLPALKEALTAAASTGCLMCFAIDEVSKSSRPSSPNIRRCCRMSIKPWTYCSSDEVDRTQMDDLLVTISLPVH